jgi:hypothetical protein
MTNAVSVRVTFFRNHRSGFPVYVTATGVLRLNGDALEFEYEESWRDPDDFMTRSAEPRVVRIELEHVQALMFKRRLFRSSLVILDASSLAAVKDLPGRQGARCVFKVRRSATPDAVDMVTETSYRLTDAQLRRLDSESR